MELSLKVLALYPGLNPKFDEVAYALPPLLKHGVSVRVITSRISALKSTEEGSDFDNFMGVQIFRLFRDLKQMSHAPELLHDEVMKLLEEFNPDLLLVNSFHCLPLMRMLQKRRRIPAVLRVESADPLIILQRRYYLGWPALGRLVGRMKWWRIAGEVDALMTNDPADLPDLGRFSVRQKQAYYSAHCAQRPDGLQLAAARDKSEMIYIGSLIRHKNCQAWLKTVPLIFDHTPVERFTIIGRGAYQHVVDDLKKRYGDRINHIAGVSRQEALERMSGAYFSYTESTSGWGFLCDSWSTNTPLLCPQSTFSIVPGWTGMMPRSPDQLIANIRRLYADPDYYQGMQEGGRIRYVSEHTAEIVSQQYMQIFREVGMVNPTPLNK
ncbi:hypothetical protein CSZ94_03665 [Janthinobacterium sp. ROICE36]|nr:hypothetical protein CSZ94_03665 [Janthinobacterium sp. ROICE36]